MGFQFVHIESYSRKADDKGRSSSFVLDEAERRPEACTHVENPAPPILVFGVPVAEVRVLHDQQAAEAVTTTKAGKTRRIRSDQHTLLTAIASHPVSMEEMRADPAKAAEVEDWQHRTVDWLRDRWGDRLVSVIRHDDEAYPHLHAYLLPTDPERRARQLHPGVMAKAEAKEAAEAEGLDGKASNAAGDRAYKEAMRQMQNDYWQKVGIQCGLTRLGPGRRRLDRAGWQAEKAIAATTAVALREVAQARRETVQARQETVQARQETAGVRDQASAIIDAAEARQRELEERARAFVRAAREKAAEAKTAADAAEEKRRAEEAEADRLRIEVENARAEIGRFRRLGERIGAAIMSVLGQAPSRVADRAAGAARAEERGASAAEVERLRASEADAWSRLRKAEHLVANLKASVSGLAQQRDVAWSHVAGMQDDNKPVGVNITRNGD
jgi:hypothetical protein